MSIITRCFLYRAFTVLIKSVNNSLEGTIKQSVHELGGLLTSVKGSISSSKKANQALLNNEEVAADADRILHPLMSLLNEKLSIFSKICERTVLKKLMEELWKIVMYRIEKSIVLPKMSQKNVILKKNIQYSPPRLE